MSFKTLSAICRGRWFIDKQWATEHLPLVAKMLQGEAVSFGHDKRNESPEAKAIAVAHTGSAVATVYEVNANSNVSVLPQGSIAMISITGPVTKYGDVCAWGSVDYMAAINNAANLPSISGIILSIDSPGGEVAGTAMLADAIKAAAKVKPVVSVINDGIAASAAMWIASAATEIYTTQPSDMVGSIGVYTTIVDWYSYLETQGLKVRDIYAPQSTEKNLGYNQALSGNDSIIVDELKLLADSFIATVRANRSGKLTSDVWTKGAMFFSKDAARIGLTDGQKTFAQIVKRVEQLSKQNQTSFTKTNNMAFEKTLAAAKSENFEVVEGGFLLQENQLNNIESALAAENTFNAAIATAQAEVARLTGELTTANSSLTEANNNLSAAQQRIAELEAMAGKASGTTAPADPDRTMPKALGNPNSSINRAAASVGL